MPGHHTLLWNLDTVRKRMAVYDAQASVRRIGMTTHLPAYYRGLKSQLQLKKHGSKMRQAIKGFRYGINNQQRFLSKSTLPTLQDYLSSVKLMASLPRGSQTVRLAVRHGFHPNKASEGHRAGIQFGWHKTGNSAARTILNSGLMIEGNTLPMCSNLFVQPCPLLCLIDCFVPWLFTMDQVLALYHA